MLKLLLVKSESGGYEYSTLSSAVMAMGALGLVAWFWSLEEESSSDVESSRNPSDLRLGFEAFVARISAK